jgi:hypothetical protein
MSSPITSKNRGHDKALLVALRYAFPQREHVQQLEWTHKDLDQISKHLINYWGYLPKNITTMRDGNKDLNMRPTKENIVSFPLGLLSVFDAHSNWFR